MSNKTNDALKEQQERNRLMVKEIARGALAKKHANKVIDGFDVQQPNNKEIHILITSGGMVDTFVITASPLKSDLLPDINVGLTLRYQSTDHYLEGTKTLTSFEMHKTGDIVEDKYGNKYEVATLPTVLNLLLQDNNIVQHVMGIPFQSTLKDQGYIYAKTLHDDFKSNDVTQIVHFYFGPIVLQIAINKNDFRVKIL